MAGAIGSVIGALISADAASSNSAAASQAAALQYEIAKRIQDRADEFHKMWRDEYKACEIALKNAVCGLVDYVPQYATVANRALTEVRKQFTRARVDAQRCLPLNCIGASCGVDRALSIAEAGATAWAINASIRTEDAKRDLINRSHREEKYRMVAAGHQFYQSINGLQAAASIYGQLGAAARQAASSASYGVGRFVQQALGQFGNVSRTMTEPQVQGAGGVNNSGVYREFIPLQDQGANFDSTALNRTSADGFMGPPAPGVAPISPDEFGTGDYGPTVFLGGALE